MQILRRAEYAAILLIALGFYAQSGEGWWWFALLFLVPDITMAGYVFGNHIGALVYNAGHSFLSVAALGLLMYVSGQQWLWPYVLIWTAHIAFDRMLGYGLKYASSFQDTHLGRIGRN
ncbi:DUF4260 domain-containing protein [Pseudochrobactrum sp. XF203]|uniref:DUF4260 domain-containing protein n=1 Tax=Pseudochrobactrum sp. XF203 TaxID=2879116 RepID=UPI001CE278B2|nr:DUF4260 domain-containing protein [Pseudochrobactrum sp. XF203]UCA45536.1 DUF4260 domain-containing protein [Pseudochrobactrum sp. XF203]